ncbi:MAG: patatin-like phospholipase family protein [Desulfotignum sp.]|nr:patatin-like phospholipase family protein [Desulfotignum sp.]MCF8112639.1 patatin-like phospholipase family protein [Desulfotignum sp.]MCF8124801.1 patatin-like phospholipase family protein [Desulfotignum sp.]
MDKKTGNLVVLAGKTAYEHIQKNGLSPEDISLVLGASGAAKWLVLYGLDTAIFSCWFKDRKDPLHLLGTSIGAWKFAAAVRKNPVQAFDALKDAYIHQYYRGRVTPAQVTRESERIMEAFLDKTRVDEILCHPFFRIAFSAVRCRYLLASRHRVAQLLGILAGAAVNRVSRSLQRLYLERVVFHHPQFDIRDVSFSDFPTRFVSLGKKNFQPALTASGAIPFVMEGVTNIAGAPHGMYRDGGILDYHPVFALSSDQKKFILYPHFYPYIIPGWFDKKCPRRRVTGSITDRMILLAPSEKFVARLPFGRIPDRKDFIRFQGDDATRVTAWEKAADMGRVLGDVFLDITQTGRIQDLVRPLSDMSGIR